MSQNELQRFLSDLEADEGLRGAVEGLRPEGYEGTRVPADALLGLVRERGYDVEADDLASAAAELDDSELEQVAGGLTLSAGVAGESKDVSHDKWIDVLSWSGGYDWHK